MKLPPQIARLALLLLTVGLIAASANAQMAMPQTYDSLEWNVADSNLVVQGHVESATPVPGSPEPDVELKLTVHIDKTLKGSPPPELHLTSTRTSGITEPWIARKTNVLLFLQDVRRLPGRPTENSYFERSRIELDKPNLIYNAQKQKLTDTPVILALIPQIVKNQKSRAFVSKTVPLPSPRGETLRVPEEVPRVPHWGLDPPPNLDPSAAFDGDRILTSIDTTAYIWDASTGKILRKFETKDPVTAVAFTPDGTHIMTGGKEGTLSLWDIATGRLDRSLGPLKSAVTKIVFRPRSNLAGERSVFGGDPFVITTNQLHGHLGWGIDPQLQTLWNVDTGEAVFVFPGVGATFSPDGASVVALQDYYTYDPGWVAVWKLPTNVPSYLQTFGINGAGNSYGSAAFAPSGQGLLTASMRGDGLQVWDYRTGAKTATVAPGNFWNALFTSDGRKVVASEPGGSLTVFEASSGTPIHHLIYPQNFPHSDEGMILSLDGTRLIVKWWGMDKDQTGSLWNLDTGQELVKFYQPIVGFSPDSRTLCGLDKTRRVATIWDAATGKVLRTLELPIASGTPG